MTWPVVRLGDVVAIRARQVDPRVPPYRDMLLVNGENIASGSPRLTFRRTAGDESAISGKYLFEPGDVLYSKLRPYLRKVVVAEEPGLCSADMYPLTPSAEVLDRRWLAWMLLSEPFTRWAIEQSARARMPKLNREQLLGYRFRIPPIDSQRRVAVRLAGQVARSERVHVVWSSLGQAMDEFVDALLRRIAVHASERWPSSELGEMASTRPSPSTATDGEVEVVAITSGCLTPNGFSTTGLRPNRMSAAAAAIARVEPGEVLVSRSNTAETVGRAALYCGLPPHVTATDLIFRMVADPSTLLPSFLAWFLSSLQAGGYWRTKSRGASSTMSKITKAQLMSVLVAVPPMDEQRRIVAELESRLEAIDRVRAGLDAELEALGALPGALLRQAFAG